MESSTANSISNPALSLNEHATIVRKKRSYFYVGIAIASLLIVLAGFSFTYIVPMASGTFAGRPLIHIHGFIFFCWLLLFIAQPTLVRNGNMKVHRKIGVFGFVLAVVMFVIGLVVAIYTAKVKSPEILTAGLLPKAFLLIPVTDMLLFATFIGLSLANLKRSETHKRLMVLATVAILPAAFGRLFNLFEVQNPLVILLISESIIIVAVVYDWIVRKKVHSVYIWGGVIMTIIHAIRFPIANSSWWLSVSDWLTQ